MSPLKSFKVTKLTLEFIKKLKANVYFKTMENINHKHLELIDDVSFNNEIFQKLKKTEKEKYMLIEYLKQILNCFIDQFCKKQKMKASLGIK